MLIKTFSGLTVTYPSILDHRPPFLEECGNICTGCSLLHNLPSPTLGFTPAESCCWVSVSLLLRHFHLVMMQLCSILLWQPPTCPIWMIKSCDSSWDSREGKQEGVKHSSNSSSSSSMVVCQACC